jgi:polysaccharide pyruvyl transferase WcaK-like protein
MLTGQQLGPFRSRLYRDALMRQLNKVDFLGLRDPSTSIDLCRNAGMDEHRYHLMGDDSLALMPSDTDIVRSVLRENHLEPGHFIAINLRLSTYGINSDRGFKHSMDLIKQIIRRVDMPLVLIPISVADHDSDHRAGLQLKHAGLPVTPLHLSAPSASLIKGILGQAYGAVGTSYHFCTFALSQGVPALCVYEGDYYAQKARSIEQFWHQSELSIDVSETSGNVSDILAKWQNESLRRHLVERYLQNKITWEYLFDHNIRNVFGL